MVLSRVACSLRGALLFWGVPARAADPAPNVRLTWSAPATCPTEAAVRDRVASLLERGAEVDARAEVTEVGAAFKLALNLQTGSTEGERTLEADSCSVLAESAAVIVAMSAVARSVPREPVPLAPEERHDVEAASAKESRAPIRVFRVFPYGALDVGTLPKGAVGAGIGAAVTWARGPTLAVLGAAWAAENGALAEDAGQGAHFQL